MIIYFELPPTVLIEGICCSIVWTYLELEENPHRSEEGLIKNLIVLIKLNYFYIMFNMNQSLI